MSGCNQVPTPFQLASICQAPSMCQVVSHQGSTLPTRPLWADATGFESVGVPAAGRGYGYHGWWSPSSWNDRCHAPLLVIWPITNKKGVATCHFMLIIAAGSESIHPSTNCKECGRNLSATWTWSMNHIVLISSRCENVVITGPIVGHGLR